MDLTTALLLGHVKKCDNPECMRLTSGGSAFCCGECAHAGENRYEIHSHSEGCDVRAAGRKEEFGWDPEVPRGGAVWL